MSRNRILLVSTSIQLSVNSISRESKVSTSDQWVLLAAVTMRIHSLCVTSVTDDILNS
jgi:hypothetical protein